MSEDCATEYGAASKDCDCDDRASLDDAFDYGSSDHGFSDDGVYYDSALQFVNFPVHTGHMACLHLVWGFCCIRVTVVLLCGLKTAS